MISTHPLGETRSVGEEMSSIQSASMPPTIIPLRQSSPATSLAMFASTDPRA